LLAAPKVGDLPFSRGCLFEKCRAELQEVCKDLYLSQFPCPRGVADKVWESLKMLGFLSQQNLTPATS
jgi:hypothetical protein